jgi:hypothetical protein
MYNFMLYLTFDFAAKILFIYYINRISFERDDWFVIRSKVAVRNNSILLLPASLLRLARDNKYRNCFLRLSRATPNGVVLCLLPCFY